MVIVIDAVMVRVLGSDFARPSAFVMSNALLFRALFGNIMMGHLTQVSVAIVILITIKCYP